jgi:hypothetical protein
MPHILQRTLDPRVTPARIVGRHADHQTPDFASYARSAGALPGVGPLSGNQRAVPSENRVRRHRRRDMCNLWRRRRCPSTARRRGCRSTSRSRRLPSCRAILFAKVGDHIALLTIEPGKQRRQQHLQRYHTSTLNACSSPSQFSDSTPFTNEVTAEVQHPPRSCPGWARDDVSGVSEEDQGQVRDAAAVQGRMRWSTCSSPAGSRPGQSRCRTEAMTLHAYIALGFESSGHFRGR